MGHYWRELDPEGAAAHDRALARHRAARDKLQRLKCKNLTVPEMIACVRVYDNAPDERSLEIVEALPEDP